MKVRFLEDETIRDPKSGEVISSFTKGQEIDLSPSGAAYFFARKSAEPVVARPIDGPAEAPPQREEPAQPSIGKRARL